MYIAVDAMGGDHAPDVVVQGALEAAWEEGFNIVLVGDREAIRDSIAGHPGGKYARVEHCEDVVGMDEAPSRSVRRKSQSSIRVAFELLKEGRADAVVSAGNSGATLAAGIMTLGRIKGVDRPAIASILPADQGEVILIDVGANVDCRATHLFHFGVMAHAFATSCLGMDSPKIGLLNVGEEAGKGNEHVRQAYDLFRARHPDFVGNVEGKDIFTGKVQIIVCDGFVGNVALKVSEGLGHDVTRMLEEEASRLFHGNPDLTLIRETLSRFRRRLDYAEYGGAPILGMNGVGIVSHGSSSDRAIKNAVKMAARYVQNRVQERLSLKLAEFQEG